MTNSCLSRPLPVSHHPPTHPPHHPPTCGSLTNFSRQSTKFVPLKGSPPMPTTVDWPRPSLVVWYTASYVRVPLRDTIPIFPGLWM